MRMTNDVMSCACFRKLSSSDLHSRLKTRKVLGVGETDDGDVHRSKVSGMAFRNLYVTVGVHLHDAALTPYLERKKKTCSWRFAEMEREMGWVRILKRVGCLQSGERDRQIDR